MAADRIHIVDCAAGTPRPDWCDRCQTSAALLVELHVLTAEGVSTLGTVRGCSRCDPHLFNRKG
ncbi:hypothetical protein GCM10010399_82500 [Dactylosporangium fulvum]